MEMIIAHMMDKETRQALVEAFSHLLSRLPKNGGFVIVSDANSQVVEVTDVFGTLTPRYFGYHLPFIVTDEDELIDNLNSLNESRNPQFIAGQPWKGMEVRDYYESCIKGLSL